MTSLPLKVSPPDVIPLESHNEFWRRETFPIDHSKMSYFDITKRETSMKSRRDNSLLLGVEEVNSNTFFFFFLSLILVVKRSFLNYMASLPGRNLNF